MRKVGILTYFKEYANIGTNMQSYCTLKAVQKLYPKDQVEIIHYSSWKPQVKPYLTQFSLKSLINDFIRFKKYQSFFKKEYVFSKKKLISSDLNRSLSFIKEQNYDIIYVGSDTLLELKRAKNDELTAYWLDDIIDCNKYLLAASSHNLTYNSLSEKQKKQISKSISSYKLLGVRDEATSRLLLHFMKPGDCRLHTVPDPTFTYDIDYSHINYYLNKRRLSFDKPIICLHLVRNTKWASSLARFFKNKGYIVASLRPAYYADLIFTDLSAFEQVGLYKYFDLVITHRFHDAIFSIKNLTPVIVFPEFPTDVTNYGENKSKTLLKDFNIEENFINSITNDLEDRLTTNYLSAIERFKDNIPSIKNKLQLNKHDYNSFLRLTL